jgi:hypothetical protein
MKVWIKLNWLKIVSSSWSLEHGNEPSVSIKSGKVFIIQVTINFSREIPVKKLRTSVKLDVTD